MGEDKTDTELDWQIQIDQKHEKLFFDRLCDWAQKNKEVLFRIETNIGWNAYCNVRKNIWDIPGFNYCNIVNYEMSHIQIELISYVDPANRNTLLDRDLSEAECAPLFSALSDLWFFIYPDRQIHLYEGVPDNLKVALQDAGVANKVPAKPPAYSEVFRDLISYVSTMLLIRGHWQCREKNSKHGEANNTVPNISVDNLLSIIDQIKEPSGIIDDIGFRSFVVFSRLFRNFIKYPHLIPPKWLSKLLLEATGTNSSVEKPKIYLTAKARQLFGEQDRQDKERVNCRNSEIVKRDNLIGTFPSWEMKINQMLQLGKPMDEIKSIAFSAENIHSQEASDPLTPPNRIDLTQGVKNNIERLSGYRRIRANIKGKGHWIEFRFNKRQAKIVEVLHNAKDHMLHTDDIEEKTKISVDRFKVSAQFRGHTSWRQLIESVRKGFWQLKI